MTLLTSFIKIFIHTLTFFIFINFLTKAYNKENLHLIDKLHILGISLLISILLEFCDNNLKYIITLCAIFILYKYALKTPNIFTFTSIILLNFSVLFCSLLSYFIIRIFAKIPFSYLFTKIDTTCIFYTMQFIFMLIFTYFISNYIKDSNEHDLFKFNSKKMFLIISIIFLVIIPNILKFNITSTDYSFNLLALNIVSLSLIYFVISLVIKYMNYYTNCEYDLQNKKIQNKALEETVDRLRILKHDYNNILQSINGYILTKQYSKLDEHINNLIDESKRITHVEAISPEVINQPAIYGIVGSKYFRAEKKHIEFNISVNTDISNISFDFTDLSRILGILLDNAIEATEKALHPQIYINFSYNKAKQADMIEIKNSIAPNLIVDTNTIFKKGASSKKIKSGLGLWEVKKIISSKSNSQIYADLKNQLFSQTIIIER